METLRTNHAENMEVLRQQGEALRQQNEFLRQQGESLRQQSESLRQQGESLQVLIRGMENMIERTSPKRDSQ